uniref:Uncharacterized protein n=1 Tax=Romanomermis culicivorax TaxID=13658 RepID=A0A915J5E3_ROMCU
MARSFFSGSHQPLRSDSNSWSTANVGDYQQNLISPSCNWSSMRPKSSMVGGRRGGFMDFAAPNDENFDSAFGGLSLSDQNSRFMNGYHTEFRPGTKWEPPRQQAVGPMAPNVSRPQSIFKNNGPAAGFGPFDASRNIIGSGFDGNAPSFLTPAGGARPPSWNTNLTTAPPPPVFRAPPQQQQPPQTLMAAAANIDG